MRWALTTDDDTSRVVIMHSSDDLFFPDTDSPWWYQSKDLDEMQLDHSMKAFKIEEEENNFDSLQLDLLNLYQEQQDDRTIDNNIVIIFVIGALFLMVSAWTIAGLVRRRALKKNMRQIITDNNPVYGENFYYEDSTVTDINDSYDW